MHKYLTAESKADDSFLNKRMRQAYGLLLGAVQRSLDSLSGVRGKVGGWRDRVCEKLSALQKQLREIYVESVWMLEENYILAMDLLNSYVLFARAFCDSHHAAQLEKRELSFPAYLGQVKALYMLAGMSLSQDDEQRAREFFDEAKSLWENQQLSIEDKENVLNILLECMKKAVALHLGKFDKAIGFGYYDVYEKLAQGKKPFTLEEYVEECRKTFVGQWKDELFMRDRAAQYYVYSGHHIEAINEDYLRKYAADHTRFVRLQRMASRAMDLAVERYLEFYEYLVNVYFDEDVAEFAKQSGHEHKDIKGLEARLDRLNALNMKALDIFGYYGSEVKNFIEGSRVYTWATKTLRLDIPFEFVKTNTLRLFQLGGIVVKKFREGMTIIYDKSSHTLTVVIETVKNPAKLKESMIGGFKQLKSMTMGYYLVLDFDADGWVSMSDFWASMGKLYKILKEMDYVGEAKALYMKALGYIHLAAKEAKPGEKPEIEMKTMTSETASKS